MPDAEVNKRDIRLDAIRGIAMVFIIVGHTVSSSAAARSFIFSFHVPVFFFLSGYLFRLKPGKLKATIVRCMKPYAFTAGAVVVLQTLKASVRGGTLRRMYAGNGLKQPSICPAPEQIFLTLKYHR